MTIVLLKWNGQMLIKWLSSSGDVVHVFMSSFSETADAENTASSTRFSMYVCSRLNETARLCHSLTKMQNMQDSYLNSVFAA